MAITFDDGPNPVVTRGILELLERYNATATFFLIGQRVRAFPDLAREIGLRGHDLVERSIGTVHWISAGLARRVVQII